MYRLAGRHLLPVVVLILSVYSQCISQDSAKPSDPTIYQRIDAYIIHYYVPQLDSSLVDSTAFHSVILDVHSTCDTSYLLCSFVYRNEGYGDRGVSSLVVVFKFYDGHLEGCGYAKAGSVGTGNLFLSGDQLYAEYVTDYSVSGWATTHYYLMQVMPSFIPSCFSASIYDYATVSEVSTSYRFVKLFPDSTGNLTQAILWSTDLAQNWETHELLSRRDSISAFVLPLSEPSRDSLLLANQDSMKAIFLTAAHAIRFSPYVADSLTQTGYRGQLAVTKPFVSDSILSDRLMQIVLPHLAPALKNYSIDQVSPKIRIENIDWTAGGPLFDVTVKLHWVAEYDLKFNVLDLKIADSCGVLREISLETRRVPSTGY